MILADFIVYTARKRAPATALQYGRYLEAFKGWAGAHRPVDELSYDLLSDYHVHLTGQTGRHNRTRRASTIVKHFSGIELAWKWAWKRQARGAYHGVPQPDSLELQRAPGAHRLAPSWDQMDATISVAEGWMCVLYIVLRCTGLRVQQAMRLRWDDFHQDGRDGLVLVLRGELGKMGQEKRGRIVPVAPVLEREMAGWGRREGWLVPCPRMHVNGTENRLARARDAGRAWARAGVPADLWHENPHHAFRAGFSSGLKRLGADDEAVEFLVGHSRGIRDRYVGPDALPLVEAVKLVPPIAWGTPGVQADRHLAIATE